MTQYAPTILLIRVLRLTLLLVLAAVLLLGQGCKSKSGTSDYSLVFYQIRFDLPWTVDPQQIQSSRPKKGAVGFRLTHDTQTLELLNGQLKLNGKGYGTVKAGDHVKVTEEGKLFVNGEERKPDGKTQG